MKALNTILLLLIVQLGFSQVKPNKVWTDYQTFEGIRIEYKYTLCTPDNGREQVLVLFRYTNTTQDKVELTWKSEKWRNNICVNCNSTSPEHNRSLTLEPNEVFEADGSTKRIKQHYIFSNFSTLVPGMTDQHLTDFKFQNISKKIIQ
ncbi:hypothetical protein N9242_06560 [Vicingaceae bacterium]|jgi:hypothetical protein|nr:hypothetical protein [Vicingaceae bacterium]